MVSVTSFPAAFMQAPSAVALTEVGLTTEAAADAGLDSLLDRWLSHQSVSTATATDDSNSSSTLSSNARKARSSGNGNGRQRSKASKQSAVSEADSTLQQSAESWEAVLGPVTSSLDSLSSLEDVSTTCRL